MVKAPLDTRALCSFTSIVEVVELPPRLIVPVTAASLYTLMVAPSTRKSPPTDIKVSALLEPRVTMLVLEPKVKLPVTDSGASVETVEPWSDKLPLAATCAPACTTLAMPAVMVRF